MFGQSPWTLVSLYLSLIWKPSNCTRAISYIFPLLTIQSISSWFINIYERRKMRLFVSFYNTFRVTRLFHLCHMTSNLISLCLDKPLSNSLMEIHVFVSFILNGSNLDQKVPNYQNPAIVTCYLVLFELNIWTEYSAYTPLY